MTQTLIEQLEKLPQVLAGEGPFYDVCVKLSDVRAIIEQAKAEKQEPAHKGYYHKETDTPVSIGQWNSIVEKFANSPDDLTTIIAMPKLYTAPQPDIVAELVKAFEHIRECLEDANNDGVINDTLWASKYETLFDYMDAALAKAKEMMG